MDDPFLHFDSDATIAALLSNGHSGLAVGRATHLSTLLAETADDSCTSAQRTNDDLLRLLAALSVTLHTDVVQQRFPYVVETWAPPYDMRDVRVECTTMFAGVAVMVSGLGNKRAVPRGTL